MEQKAEPSTQPYELLKVLLDEYAYLHGGRERIPADPVDIKALYAARGAMEDSEALSALCFSGGGIRSATFNLGVLQALARHGLLDKFDFLSSVSGGGYISAWLQSWKTHAQLQDVIEALAPADPSIRNPLRPEPGPVDHLREFSNYLTPRVGLLTADTWAALAIIIRNLALNWLVLVPLFLIVVLIPQLALIFNVLAVSSPDSGSLSIWLLVACVLALFSSITLWRMHRQRDFPAKPWQVNWIGILPLWGAAIFLCAWLRLSAPNLFFRPVHDLAIFCAFWCVGIPLVGWLIAAVTVPRQSRVIHWVREIVAIVVSGALMALALYWTLHELSPKIGKLPALVTVFGVPLLLGIYLLGRLLFVAFVGVVEDRNDEKDFVNANADREWWARVSGSILILIVIWIVFSGLVIYGAYGEIWLLGHVTGKTFAAAAAVATTVSGLLGASPKTGSKSGEKADGMSRIFEILLKLIAPIAIALLAIVIAKLSARSIMLVAGRLGPYLDIDFSPIENVFLNQSAPAQIFPAFSVLVFEAIVLGVAFAFLTVSMVMSFIVNVNRYSLLGLYRNRLVRAYLGASNPERRPDPFTGFDPDDDLYLSKLQNPASPRPLPVINATLNLVSGGKLAWQQRKAESFSMTPLYCGNFYDGYRRTSEYGGTSGLTLGTAISISGAAASPNSGYHSSPVVSFLMTLMNLRLGCWLGNTGKPGTHTFGNSGPRCAWALCWAICWA